MRIGVLGTGTVGRTLAARFAELGHDVVVGTRDPEATGSRPEWRDRDLPLVTFAAAAAHAELVVNASSGTATLEVLHAAGAANLGGTVLVDVANPLDFSRGMPPTLTVKDTDSLGEQVQRAFPAARVVKTLNTVNAALMVHPEQLPGGHTVFLSGDDAGAKATVRELLTALGHTDVLDLGGIESARGAEMYLPLWLRTMATLGTGVFNIKVVRGD